jgi:ubiquinone/menaquinone biosynthesis C-methylase UbiE
LDLGCGAYSYVKSVGFDLSEKMLQFNDNCSEKVVGDLNARLQFGDGSFDSVTAIFVLNYVENLTGLLYEIRRVLRSSGKFMVVLYSGQVNPWQRQKEVCHLKLFEWKDLLVKGGFQVRGWEKEGLWFLEGK